ncbi:uncharacterized protein GJ701_004823 [Geothlypis trichas]
MDPGNPKVPLAAGLRSRRVALCLFPRDQASQISGGATRSRAHIGDPWRFGCFLSEALETSRSSAALLHAGQPRAAALTPLPVGSLGLNSPGFQQWFVFTTGLGGPHGVGCPWGVPPSPSPTAPELDSGCLAEGGQKWRFGAGLGGELADGGLAITGAETAYVSVTRASSESRCWRAGQCRRCPAASGTERSGAAPQCECNYPARV